ncbi:hypothetical protein F5Y00DRAFT_257492 [Daldinia vernicosa]|uniref:uncharacterized protein n=1 Tax=Daldinia vernicosa TaxID=114800 RepID=UPI002008A6F1|nr:uncharacterized protein F5Y00DRAFT_257492 [Daldinia vernicosa]KAI0853471.1 hypothetical protein F5Y00DRAFT_257492 [Daldinia vernicosa]
MTEAAGYVAYQKASEETPDGVTGKLLPNIEACLKKEGSTEDVPEGQPGELWLRGPNFTQGYDFNEEANKKGFPMKGWYNTGDGFQVSSAELESYINAHPNVVEGGVSALWDESQLTELPTAWVILKDRFKTPQEKKNALKEVHQAVDSQVSSYKKLRGGVWEIKALPKNATGKILRKQMVAMRDGVCSLENSPKAKL